MIYSNTLATSRPLTQDLATAAGHANDLCGGQLYRRYLALSLQCLGTWQPEGQEDSYHLGSTARDA